MIKQKEFEEFTQWMKMDNPVYVVVYNYRQKMIQTLENLLQEDPKIDDYFALLLKK